MPGNIINIQFNQDLPVGGTLAFDAQYTPAAGGVQNSQMFEAWVPLRNAANKVTTGTPTATPGERSAINFMQAFNLDYNATLQFAVTRSVNTVTIVAPSNNVSGWTFSGGYAFTGNGFELADVEFTFGILNNTPFQVSNVTFSPRFGYNCTHVLVNVTTTTQASQVTGPQMVSGQFFNQEVTTNPFTFWYPRGQLFKLSVKNPQNISASELIQTPAYLSADNFTININNSPNGATLLISYVNQFGIIPTYALSPPNTSPTSGSYQSDPMFTGIAPGNYQLSIKDQFGCIKTKLFTVAEFGGARSPFFFISKAMSFRFAQRVIWGDAGNYKTDENTLSCEADTIVVFKEIQQFQTADVITTQFKSNYATNTATIIRNSGEEIDVPVQLMSNNIGVKDKRDATRVALEGGKMGVYFQSGNTYDYDTGAITGTYALNGALPYWATINGYFSINNVWFQIEETYFDEDLNVDMLVIDYAYTGDVEAVVVGSIYDLFPYEVYEFTIDLVDYQEENIQVRINGQDPEFSEIVYLSEVINVKVRQPKTIEIKYSNPENTDVFYSTGIVNLIRQRYTTKGAVPDETSEAYKTDTKTVLQSSEVYEVTNFVFEPVTTEIMRKMVQAFNHKTLTLDGVGYVKNGNTEVEGPLGVSNAYVVKVNLIKTANAFNSNLAGADNELFDTSNTEIPGFIDQGNGSFVEY